MSRRWVTPFAAAVLAACPVLGACGDDDGGDRETQDEAPARAVGPPSRFFPLSPGDRWRYRVEPTGTVHAEGVTGMDDRGHAGVHGSGHALAERYAADDDGGSLVTPEGETVTPLLRAPLRAGSSWEYEIEERGMSIDCEARVDEASIDASAAGRAMEGCIRVERSCRYPAGSPFPEATTHTTEETYCPGVGRVKERAVFHPAPPTGTLPPERTEVLVGYRVRGAPVLEPEPELDCDELILLPSDVQAACGANVQPVEPIAGRSEEGTCTYAYRSEDGEIAIDARRLGHEVRDDELDALLRDGSETGIRLHEDVRILTVDAVRLAFREGRVVVRLSADESACAEESTLRLVPLLRSLVRR